MYSYTSLNEISDDVLNEIDARHASGEYIMVDGMRRFHFTIIPDADYYLFNEILDHLNQDDCVELFFRSSRDFKTMISMLSTHQSKAPKQFPAIYIEPIETNRLLELKKLCVPGARIIIGSKNVLMSGYKPESETSDPPIYETEVPPAAILNDVFEWVNIMCTQGKKDMVFVLRIQ